jgi:hypothetical protein
MPDTRPWVVDPSCRPLCYASVHNNGLATPPEDADIEEFDHAMTAEVDRGEPMVIVVDSRFVRGLVTAKQRAYFARRMQESATALERACVGIAVVVKSPLVRGALTAVLWLLSTPCPVKAWSDLDDALDWLTDELQQRGCEVPASVRAMMVERFRQAAR